MLVDKDNTNIRDPTMEAIMLPSGKPLVSTCLFILNLREVFLSCKSKHELHSLCQYVGIIFVFIFSVCEKQFMVHTLVDCRTFSSSDIVYRLIIGMRKMQTLFFSE